MQRLCKQCCKSGDDPSKAKEISNRITGSAFFSCDLIDNILAVQ